jgi:hypothetical protein
MEKHGGMILAGDLLILAKQEELGEGKFEFGPLKYLCSYFEGILKYAIQSYDMGPTALLTFRRKACFGFYRSRPGLNP